MAGLQFWQWIYAEDSPEASSLLNDYFRGKEGCRARYSQKWLNYWGEMISARDAFRPS